MPVRIGGFSLCYGSSRVANFVVIEVQWDDSGVAVYFFPRDSVPSDIDAGSPNPDGWGAPMARWPAASCSPFEFFNSHSVIFDTTLWYVPSLFVLTARQF